MKLKSSTLHNFLFIPVLTLALPAFHAAAQTKPDTAAQSVSIAAPVPARITQAIDETQLVRLKGNVHPLARAEFDQGIVSDATPMKRMMLVLQRSPEQQAALAQFMDEQLSKDSPNFHKWLTPDQFGKQFGPADADIQTVTAWLTRQGFQDIKVGAGRTAIEFSGNVGQVRNAFHSEIHRFNVNGESRQANVSDPQVPAALMPVVSGIVSLHDFPRKSLRHIVGVFTRTADGRVIPQFTTSGGSFVVGPADFAKIYNIPPSLDGTGVNIAIVADSNINAQDVIDFQNLFGLPANFTSQNIVLNGPDPGISGSEGEADLDVQMASMVAPKAVVNLVVSESTLTAAGIDLSSFYIIDNNAADVMSLSFGACEAGLGNAGNAFYNSLWEQAAAQGISVMVAAGDPGSAGCDDFNNASVATLGLAISGIASTPFNVAVGGTDFDDATTQTSFWNTSANNAAVTRESALGYIPEVPWNDSCAATATSATLNTVCVNPTPSSLLNIVGGSGGPSTCATQNSAGTCTAGNPKPSWQNGMTPADGHRDIPDVSLFASDGPQSQSFYLLCQADGISAGSAPSCAPDSTGHFSFFGAGGTSASSPAFAGIMALINQSQVNAGKIGRQGNANLTLYKIAQTASNSCNSSSRTIPTLPPPAGCVFNDVTKGNNSVPCAGNSPNCSSTTSGSNGVLFTTVGTTKTPAFSTTSGYDFATGLGTVNVANLATAWGTAVGAFKGTTTTLKINGGISTVNITHGTSVASVATVSPTSGTVMPTGEVSLLASTSVNGGIAAGSLTVGTTNSTASFPPTGQALILPGGSYSVAAHYAGDGNFSASNSNAVPVKVNPEPSRLQYGIVTFDPVSGNITSTNATSVAYGSPYILRMDILNSSGNACQPLVNGGTITGCAFDATGTVTINDGSSHLDTGTFILNSAGSAEDQPIQLAPGTHPLSATYSGDISYTPVATAVTDTVMVTKAATTTQVVPNPSSVVSGGSVTLTATVATNSNGAGPTGTIQFKNGSSTLMSPVTCTPTAASSSTAASCTATLVTTFTSLMPLSVPHQMPRIPAEPIWIVSFLFLITFLLILRRVPPTRRAYVFAALVLFMVAAAGIAGCGSSSGSVGGGGGGHTDSITAVYGGDTNYSGSTSAAVVVSVQ